MPHDFRVLCALVCIAACRGLDTNQRQLSLDGDASALVQLGKEIRTAEQDEPLTTVKSKAEEARDQRQLHNHLIALSNGISSGLRDTRATLNTLKKNIKSTNKGLTSVVSLNDEALLAQLETQMQNFLNHTYHSWTPLRTSLRHLEQATVDVVRLEGQDDKAAALNTTLQEADRKVDAYLHRIWMAWYMKMDAFQQQRSGASAESASIASSATHVTLNSSFQDLNESFKVESIDYILRISEYLNKGDEDLQTFRMRFEAAFSDLESAMDQYILGKLDSRQTRDVHRAFDKIKQTAVALAVDVTGAANDTSLAFEGPGALLGDLNSTTNMLGNTAPSRHLSFAAAVAAITLAFL